MPWKIQKSGSGYYVVTTSTGRKHSKHTLSLKKAKAQLAALHIHAHSPRKSPRRSSRSPKRSPKRSSRRSPKKSPRRKSRKRI